MKPVFCCSYGVPYVYPHTEAYKLLLPMTVSSFVAILLEMFIWPLIFIPYSSRSSIVSGKYKTTRVQDTSVLLVALDDHTPTGLGNLPIQGDRRLLLFYKAYTGLLHKP
ncbi:hypothetical protein BDB01DRAFT_838097 [Pilobolus umbonatus]|nr:hypothetical protein BDB01DRAFT_838097 [Pilobolus umbonatus]